MRRDNGFEARVLARVLGGVESVLDSGKCFAVWEVFCCVGSVLDSGKCFWILVSVLDSGRCCSA